METEAKMETKTETEMETKMETEAETETKTPLLETEMETETPLHETETETPLHETETETETPLHETETETETPLRETEMETQMEREMGNEKSAVTQLPLPRFIVIGEHGNWYANYKEVYSSIDLRENRVFSPMAKIEVERAKSNPNYVHLRFSHSNKYWHQRETGNIIAAQSTEPEEDVSNWLCTLFSFEPAGTSFGSDIPLFAVVHLHSGKRIRTSSLMLTINSTDTQFSRFQITNWSTLVNLPPRVAFKGYNDKYLRAVIQDRIYNYHKFESDDPNERQCGYEVFPMNDGHVRIRSDHWGMFWRRSPNWIWGDAPATPIYNNDTLFWPVMVDNDNTIGLRNAGNNMFCMALTAEGKVDCLNAGASTMTNPARLVVEEPVSDRRIYNIRYRMEHSRIFDETPFLAGSNSVINDADQEASLGVEIEYTNVVSNSFNNSTTVTAGMTNTFQGGIPFIFSGKIEVSLQGSYTREWGQTVTTSQTVKASGSVDVPPRSVALVSYVGARGTCSVPFSYTQQDRSSTNGAVTETEKIDGIFEGVNSYNFQFVVTSTRSLKLPN